MFPDSAIPQFQTVLDTSSEFGYILVVAQEERLGGGNDMSSKLKTAAVRVFLPLLYLHGLGVGPAFLYYNYSYAREHGFVSWLFLGEIIPSLKALLWEYFLVAALFSSPAQYAQDEKHYDNSREANNMAAQFLVHIEQKRSLAEEEKTEVREYLKRAYSEAQAVSDEYLDRIHPDFRRHYRGEYQESLRLHLHARESGDGLAALKGYRLQKEWGEWLDEHHEELDFP